jgi:hypothetical protein
MITPTYDDVHPPCGPLFSQNFPVMVDEYTGISAIIEGCTARSTIAGDTMNRWCAWGAVLRDTREIEAAGPYGKHP